MKVTELLSEAKAKGIKWARTENHGSEATVNGRHLEVKYSNYRFEAWIDGKLVRTFGPTLGDQTKVMRFLENEVSEAGEAGTTVKSMSQYVKSTLKGDALNGWTLDYMGAGDFMGKNKSKSFGFEYDKSITAKKEWVKKGQIPQHHRFVIQAHFEPHVQKEGMVTLWLAQGGQIISFGITPIKFKNDDLEAMIKAVKKMMAISDEEIIRKLYESGYHQYGRA